ncbi:MAG: class I SAM-dependent methyltransferase [Steroidobacteraceae bacterium]
MTVFDRDYYRRYYFDPRTAVGSPHESRMRARLIAAYVDHVGLPVRTILDAGCGIGQLRASLLRRLPRVRYVGLEVSDYLCRRYGWEPGRIEDYASATPFDLVICYDVLQYLDDRGAARAIANLARLGRGVLYFSALTRADWRNNCDRRRTDPAVHMRPAEWYRARLRRGFLEVGAGFWVRRGAPLIVWELERSGRIGRATSASMADGIHGERRMPSLGRGGLRHARGA